MFAEDVAKLITDAGLGVLGTNLFISLKANIPSGSGPITTLVETGGLTPLRVQNRLEKPAYQRPALQIVVRATSYTVARDRALAIYNIIWPVRNEMVNGIYYQEMIPLQEPFDGGVDDSNRAKIIMNIRAVKRPI